MLISTTQRNRMSAIVRVRNTDELHAAVDLCPAGIEIGKRDPNSEELDLAHIEALRAAVPGGYRVLLYNRLRTFEEAAAVAPLKPDGVLVSPLLLVQENAVARLREIFGT